MKLLNLLAITQLWINVVSLDINVVPDHPNTINCPSQPCTTLDDLLLNNSLSDISNVEFKLLPGVYDVTSNIVIQRVHNVSFVGVEYASMDVMLKCFNSVSFQVISSYNVTISNLSFTQCGGYKNLPAVGRCQIHLIAKFPRYRSPSLLIACCFLTSIKNITI